MRNCGNILAMLDIELYKKTPELYEELQHLRPDYTGAIIAVMKFSLGELKDKINVIIADFCCGTGENTKLLAEKLGGIGKAILIDINKEFLKMAEASGIKANQIDTHCTDILNVVLQNEADLVLSVFAYHHLQDGQKNDYILKIKEALKHDGVLVLAEIYIPNKETEIEYYKYLYENITKQNQTPELHKFLMETSKSNNFEFKVGKEFADKQLQDNGFVLTKSQKIWPLDNKFSENMGTFVEVWTLV